MISKAPFIHSSTVSNPFSLFIYFVTISSLFPSFTVWEIISFASGSSPFSFAIVALVLFFCLYGLYKSSTSVKIEAFKMLFFSSSVSFPCSSIRRITSSFLASKFLKYINLSFNFLRTSSLKLPVTSFLYLAIKGIVFPSSINFIVFPILFFSMFNSIDNSSIIFSIFIPLKTHI